MTTKSSNTGYGTVAIVIHWLSAGLILALIGTGFKASGTADVIEKVTLLRFHVPVGVTVLLLTLLRILWWLYADKKPASIPMPAWQARASRVVHGLLYVVISGLAVSGVGMLILSGAWASLINPDTVVLPSFTDYLPRIPHGIGARVLVCLLLFHVGAAFYHQFVKKDRLINRMWFSK